MFREQNLRIAVVGPTGSGKSTLACRLASALDLQYVDADALFHSTPAADLEDRFADALAVDRWVSDGNIGRLRPTQLPRMTSLVWLDYSLRRTLPRLLLRTLRRVFSGEVVHGVFRETFRQQFLSRDSILLFAIRRHRPSRRHYEELIESEDAKHLQVFRLSSPRQARRWLAQITE